MELFIYSSLPIKIKEAELEEEMGGKNRKRLKKRFCKRKRDFLLLWSPVFPTAGELQVLPLDWLMAFHP